MEMSLGGTAKRLAIIVDLDETLCCQLDTSDDGANLSVDRLYLILNPHFESTWAKLPPLPPGRGWYRAIDTSLAGGEDLADAGAEVRIDPADHYIASPRSTVVLVAH